MGKFRCLCIDLHCTADKLSTLMSYASDWVCTYQKCFTRENSNLQMGKWRQGTMWSFSSVSSGKAKAWMQVLMCWLSFVRAPKFSKMRLHEYSRFFLDHNEMSWILPWSDRNIWDKPTEQWRSERPLCLGITLPENHLNSVFRTQCFNSA